MRIVHIADCVVVKTGGMARVAWYWKQAFEKRGHEFIHIGSEQVGKISHVRHFPKAALRYYQKMSKQADVILVHEPTAGDFIKRGVKTVVVSHGLERRGWEIQNHENYPDNPRPALKTRLFFPLWRLRGCDMGLRHADGALLINQDDKTFAINRYSLKNDKIFVFKNGVDLASTPKSLSPENVRNILFSGTWLARKGIHTLARAAELLDQRGIKPKWILAGTGLPAEQVLKTWPKCFHSSTEVIPKFSGQEEAGLYRHCNLFVLPSFFEGQPLALLQAMANGRCCITTNTCGQKDVIKHGHNGLLFEPGDAITLAALIEKAAGNLPFQIELGANAQRTVKDRDWKVVADEVVDFVERIYSLKTHK
jgi:glycosyltransferase involved in cell wall biosynthesis